MRFRLQTDYALRALVFMAAKEGNCTTDEIASYYEISSAHLGRVIRRLQRYGFVKAIRGRRGGVRLDRDPAGITISEIVTTLEEGGQPLDPHNDEPPTLVDEQSRLKAVLKRAHGMFLSYLENVTLAELGSEGLPDKASLLAAIEEAGASDAPAAGSEAPSSSDAPAALPAPTQAPSTGAPTSH